EQYRTERGTLLAAFDEGIFTLPLDELQARLDGPYASGFKRLFSGDYRRDRATLQTLQRHVGLSGRLSYDRLKTAVETARDVLRREAMLEGDTAAATLLGTHYRGVTTDLDVLKRALEQNARYAALHGSLQGHAAITPIPADAAGDLARLRDEARA